MRNLLTAAFVLSLATASGVQAQTVDALEKLDQALVTVSSFEQGQPSDHLTAIEKFVFTLPTNSPLRAEVEKKLAGALAEAKTADAKRFLCRQLRVIGTAQCVPAVSTMLTDPEVSHIAVYCLGRLEGPEAADALRRALSQTSGDVQVDILNALADRRDGKTGKKCIPLLGSDNPAVAKAAARALGRLADPESVEVLKKARPTASPALLPEIDNALLQAAEILAATDSGKAFEIYRQFSEPSLPEPLRFGALRGMVMTAPSGQAEMLAAAFRSDDIRQRRFAFSLIPLVKGSAATSQFAAALSTLDADDQVILLRVLGERGDPAAAGALASASKSENEAVRAAALEALGTAGDPESLEALAEAAATYSGDAQKIARASLAKLPGDEVDAALKKLASGGKGTLRAEAIGALAQRGLVSATPMLLEATRDQDSQVRGAAIGALGTLAGPDDLQALVARLLQSDADEDRPALIEAIGKLFYRIPSVSARAKPLLERYGAASPKSQAALLALLGKSGAPEALARLQSTAKSSEPPLLDAAVAALAAWPDPSGMPALRDFIRTTSNPDYQQAVLKGYIRLAQVADDPTAAYLDILKHVTTVNDRKRVLESLGLHADSPEALGVAMKYLEDQPLQAAAGLAALRIAYRLRSSHEQLARESLHKVLATVDHEDVHNRAQEVLNDLDKYKDHILTWVVIGPFNEEGKDGQAIFNTVFPPEQADAKDLEWKPLTKGMHEWRINLEETFGGLDHSAAYVRTRVHSPVAQDVLIEMGSDDAVKLWVNGELLSSNWKTSAPEPRQERVPATLKEGWNVVMLKVADYSGGWEFGLRIRRPDGTKLDGLKIEAQ